MAKKYPLNSGIPCRRHRCNLCCVDTEMPLSRSDMSRIMKLGYNLKDFAVKTPEGWQLKNYSGRCVFLSEEGCKIYPYRPEGCRLYPLIYDETSETVKFDDVCPYTDEFKTTQEDIQRLINLLVQLEKERREDAAL
ncbi:YkgJ family cysteine cluster protein [Candidatus Bathyarchaeota archaeon]|nr:MAG: YkgJ family cysteine cluster protein [Candidatus Bathyarchaeota archaeon]